MLRDYLTVSTMARKVLYREYSTIDFGLITKLKCFVVISH